MHSGDLRELGEAELNQAEKDALLEVMQRAREFDEKTAQLPPQEGQLFKWTNPLKGWQPRWLKIDPNQSVLHYYVSEDKRKQPPRGSLHLFGAVVAPSEEDSQTFSVSSTNGDTFKLRAADARERQHWVSRLRQEVERCTNLGFQMATNTHTSSGPCPPTSISLNEPHTTANNDRTHSSSTPTLTTPTRSHSKRKQLSSFIARGRRSKSGKAAHHGNMSHEEGFDSELPGGDAMLVVLSRLQWYHENLVSQLENYGREAGVDPVSKDVLMLKAAAGSAVHSVKDCLAVMKVNQHRLHSNTSSSQKLSSSTGSLALPTDKPTPPSLPRPRSTSDVSDTLEVVPEPRSRTVSDGRLLGRRDSATPPSHSVSAPLEHH